MPVSELRLIKNVLEFLPKSEITRIPIRVRGIYVLYQLRHKRNLNGGSADVFDVVYVGMTRGSRTGVAQRLQVHRRNKGSLWSHFSVFEVWDNIREAEVEELEGLFRHLYRFDSKANSLNKQKSYKPLNRIRTRSKREWFRYDP